MLALDALTVPNATGSLHAPTMGHPRCATVSFSECAKGLGAFAPVVAIALCCAAGGGCARAGTAATRSVDDGSTDAAVI